MIRQPWLALAAGLALAACDGKVQVDPDMKIETGSEANIEHPEYTLQDLAWVREGRTLEFQGRSYHPVGRPIDAPLVKQVGDFEGTQVYATSESQPPYDRLLIPTTDGWQIFEVGDLGARPGTDTTTPPADTTPH